MMQKHTPISFRQVRISDGFWKERQRLNANVTIHAVRERFEETGRFSAYEGHWREGKGEKPRLYLTGDIENGSNPLPIWCRQETVKNCSPSVTMSFPALNKTNTPMVTIICG